MGEEQQQPSAASKRGVRFAAERTADGHSDRFWALALASHAARENFGGSAVSLVSRRESGFVW